MATLLTYDWTGTDGTRWDDLTAGRFWQRIGSATLGPRIQSNIGWMTDQVSAGDRTMQSRQRLSLRDHKCRWKVDWKSAATQGRWIGTFVRLSDDGKNGYWAKLTSIAHGGSPLNTPTLYIYRRRSGTDTELTRVDLTTLTGPKQVLGADLDAGVTIWMRVETQDTQVRIMAAVDKANGAGILDLLDYQLDYNDTSAARVESAGTWGVETDGNATNDDVTIDEFKAYDFEDEADPVPDYAEGFSMRINGNYFDEDALVELGLASVEVLQSYASGNAQIAARLTDVHDFHKPMFSAGDEVEILFDGLHYTRGLIRPVSHNVLPHGDQNSYELHGPKMLAREVVIKDPDTNLGAVSFNLDAEHPLYDEDKADMTLGEILQWVLDNHAEGEDGLRAHRAAPPDDAQTVYSSIPAEMTSGPVIPGFTVGGNIATAVETILNLMPKFAWRIDPETLIWYFDDRTASSVETLRTSDLHMDWKHATKVNLSRTVVFVRGGEPEVEWATLSIGTGDLEEAWNTALGLEGETSEDKKYKNIDEGTVQSFGVGGPADGPFLDRHLYVDVTGLGGDLAENEWYFGRLHFVNGPQAGNSYTVIESTAAGRFWLSKETPWYTGGPPNVGDDVRISGMRGERDPEGMGDGAENIFNDMFSAYQTSVATNAAYGKCVKGKQTIPNPAGGKVSTGIGMKMTAGQNTQSGKTIFQTAQQTQLPIGLVNYPAGRGGGYGGTSFNPKACANMGGIDSNIGDLEVEIPKRNPSVPYLRVPTTGFRGSAYTTDSAKWNGGGEPGIGDPACMIPLTVDDSNFQYQTLQQGDYIKMADAMLAIWGEVPRMADINIHQVWHTNFRTLDKRVTLIDDLDSGGGRNAYPDLENLLLVQVSWRWTPEGIATVVNCGTLNTLSGVNMDGIRRLHVDTSEQKKIKNQMKLLEEMHNCLKEQAAFAMDALNANNNQAQSACNITYNHKSFARPGRPGRRGPPGPPGVGKKLDNIQDWLDWLIWNKFMQEPGDGAGNDNADGEGGSAPLYTDQNGNQWERDPETGLWGPVDVDPDTGETTPDTDRPAGEGGGSPIPFPEIPGVDLPGFGHWPIPGGADLPGMQKGAEGHGWDGGPGGGYLLNADLTNDPAHASGNGPNFGMGSGMWVDPLVTKPVGSWPRELLAIDIPLANGGAGETFYAYRGQWYQDGGDGVANPITGGDDTALPFPRHPFDPDGDGWWENLLGGQEGYLAANKHVMEQRLLGAESGPTGIPGRQTNLGSNEPGQTDFTGNNEFHPVYDTRDPNNMGYEGNASNPQSNDNMKAGGLVGNGMADEGFTEGGSGKFAGPGGAVPPGLRAIPGSTVPTGGADYYTPDLVNGAVSGQPNIKELAQGDTVPARTLDIMHQMAALLGLAPYQLDDPAGVIFESPDGKKWMVEPGTTLPGNGFREVEAASGGPGTGINGGDWQYVTPANYFGSAEALESMGLADILTLFNGATVDKVDLTVVEDTGTVKAVVQKEGGGDVDFYLANERATLDTTPPAEVTLTAGTDTNPTLNYIWIENVASPTLAAGTAGWPSGPHVPLAQALVQSAASVAVDGAYKVHLWTDHLSDPAENGHLSHINSKVRELPASWIDGVNPNDMVAISPDAWLSVTSGNVSQLHPHAFPAKDMQTGDPAFLVNDPTTPYLRIATLDSITQDATGDTAINNKYMNLVLWGVVSEDGADSKLMLNLPNGMYTVQAQADSDDNDTADYTIPAEFRGTGFLIARYVLQAKTSGTWVQSSKHDLRGLVPSTSPGTGGGGGGGSTINQTDPDIEGMNVHEDGSASGQAEFLAFPRKVEWHTHFFLPATAAALNPNGVQILSTGTPGGIATTTLRDGVHRITTSTTAGDGMGYRMADDGSGSAKDPTKKFVYEGWVNVGPTAVPPGYDATFGLADSAFPAGLGGVVDAIFFTGNPAVNGGQWQVHTVAAGIPTTTNTAVGVTGWARLKATFDGTSVRFYINGTLVATHTTNIPTALTMGYYYTLQTQDPSSLDGDIDAAGILMEPSNV